MAIFDESTFGKPISETLMVIIKANKAKLNIQEIASRYTYTVYKGMEKEETRTYEETTLNQLLLGYRGVNKNYRDMLEEVLKKCLKKTIEMIENTK